MYPSEKWCCSHSLLDLLIKPIKFQLNWQKTQHFQLKLFNIAVTLVKVTESSRNRESPMSPTYHDRAQFDADQILLIVSE